MRGLTAVLNASTETKRRLIASAGVGIGAGAGNIMGSVGYGYLTIMVVAVITAAIAYFLLSVLISQK
jgi:uncharacterized membrane protein YgaE (UPF0421/DUF939 family)